MENRIISIDTLQKLLNPREMKNVLGGSGAWPCNSTTKCEKTSDCKSNQVCATCYDDGEKYCG